MCLLAWLRPFNEREDCVEIRFKNSSPVTADILVAADGIRSAVSRQAFGDPKLFHTGIRLWLAWCDHIPDVPPNVGVISHDCQHQASFFPMLHDGKPGFEWWVVEPVWEGQPLPEDPKAHFAKILDGWAEPMPRLFEATDLDTQVYRWEVYSEARRADHVNHHVEFALFTSSMFHSLPWPLTKLRDWIFDYTPVLSRLLQKEYLQRAEDELMSLKELHVM